MPINKINMKKRSVLLFLFLLASLQLFSQISADITSRINYQFTVRDKAGALVVNNTIGLQINIIKGTETGPIVYAEKLKQQIKK